MNASPMPDWRGATVVVLASGPSLTEAQCERVRLWRQADDSGARRVVVINTTFRSALWADMLYACDRRWWQMYGREVEQTFAGAKWTQDAPSAAEFGLGYVRSVARGGLCREPGTIHQGGPGCGNSGFQVINLLWHFGVRHLLLVGYDMRASRRGKTHHHGDHPEGLSQTMPFGSWIKQLNALATELRHVDVDVINCTPDSALHCFPTADLDMALDDQTAEAA